MDHMTSFLKTDRPKESGGSLGVFLPPLPPPMEILTPTERALTAPHLKAQPATVPLFRFEFRRQYSRLYTNGQRFVLRQEHVEELKRLVNEHHHELRGTDPLTMSDIVNSALDVAFEHQKAFHSFVRPETLRESLTREIYRTAFAHFMRHEAI